VRRITKIKLIMTEQITPRFAKGDTVYAAEATHGEKWVSCPDCLGTKIWTVIFADGDAREVECQTCKRGYLPATGQIKTGMWTPCVRKLTVGSIRYNDTDKKPFSYMCNETGVGSGRVYYDDDLFATHDEALPVANERYEQQMRHLAENNFGSKRDRVEDMLSTFGFTRSQAVEHALKFRQWAGIAGITKKRKPKAN
jgi:hypothetical protein